MKLWQKEGTHIDELVERFTVGRDREFDLLLAAYDVRGSMAHAEMLSRVGLLTEEEAGAIRSALRDIGHDIEAGRFEIGANVEDVHSQVEFLLTERLGDIGKKIHSGRSRNDQVALDIKLLLKDSLKEIWSAVRRLFDTLLALSERYKRHLMPGYTHLQVAMASSFGLWFGAYAESLVDDMELLAAAYTVTDKNPLGSGAGYGSSLPLDRAATTSLLGFADLHHNVVYAQMSRGKTEKFVAMGMAALAATLSKLSMDVCLFMSENFGFVRFPDALTTGSSIMPHKKNPDVFELVRGKCNRIQAIPNEMTLLLSNLPSGYHRELQLSKEIVFPGIANLLDCLGILNHAMPQIQVREGLLDDEKYRYVFTVEAVNDRVKRGRSFRDAYREVGNEVEQGRFEYDGFTIDHHVHEGSMGNLCNDKIEAAMLQIDERFR